MKFLPINQYGDPILRKITSKVENIDDELVEIVQSMFATMRNANGVGLAGNQVGLDKQIFVVDVSPIEGLEHIKPVVMINPQIIDQSDEKVIYEEGCLSLPDLRLEVERPEIIKVKFLNMAEEEEEIEADDFFARVILHEYDHLIGKMIPDRVGKNENLKIQELLSRIKNREVNCEYPIT